MTTNEPTEDYEQWNGVNIPTGYTIEDGKVYPYKDMPYGKFLLPKICNSPIVVSKIGVNTINNRHWACVMFEDMHGRVYEQWITYEAALSRRGVMELVKTGLLVVPDKTSALNTYLSESISITPPLERITGTTFDYQTKVVKHDH